MLCPPSPLPHVTEVADDEKNALLEELAPLKELLDDVRILVETFNKKGFMKKMLQMKKHAKTLKFLDRKIVQLFQSLKDRVRVGLELIPILLHTTKYRFQHEY